MKMKNMTYKEFIEQVKTQLNTFSLQDLRFIIQMWATEQSPAKREEFLRKLTLQQNIIVKDPESINGNILEELTLFADRVKDGEFYEGYGWDSEIDDERAFGDESWAEEVETFFIEANKSLRNGNYELAITINEVLFNLLAEYSEYLPGQYDVEDNITTDLNEARSCYLRATYLSSPINERCERMLEVVEKIQGDINENVNLKAMLNVDTEILPDFDDFLLGWIELLKKHDQHHNRFLLREAIKLSGGVKALATFAQEEGSTHPEAFIDWIAELERKEDYQQMIDAAEKGLEDVIGTYGPLRAEIAEALVKAGKHMNSLEIQLKGWQEAFYSYPSLSRLLFLLTIAEKKNIYQEEIETAIKITKTAKISDNLQTQLYLLAGDYKAAFNFCKDKKALGWTYGTNPKILVIPFFLKYLAKGETLNSGVNRLWEWALLNTYSQNRFEAINEHYQQAMDNIIETIYLTPKEEKKYLEWCIKETGERIDAIVKNQYRKSYYKAAMLLIATAEVLIIQGEKSMGYDLLKKYRQQYPHHRRFQQEVKIALSSSHSIL
jgi:hypothetical protein